MSFFYFCPRRPKNTGTTAAVYRVTVWRVSIANAIGPSGANMKMILTVFAGSAHLGEYPSVGSAGCSACLQSGKSNRLRQLSIK
jgi:hypothetical protein